jgi:muconate cycloisomerase
MACLAAGLTAFPTESVPGDFQAALFYERSSVEAPLAFKDGRVEVPRGPGFGVAPVLLEEE